MTPLVLIYNMEGERKRQVELLAACHGIRVRAVPAAEYGRALGTLCGLPEEGGAPGLWNGFAEEMLVMAHFTEPLFHRFVDGFRQAGIAPIRLKAVLTETNKSWNSCELRAELVREEAAFRAMKAQSPRHDG